MESRNLNPSSPDELDELRLQIAALTRRIAALEQQAGTFRSNLPASTQVTEGRVERRTGLTLVNRIGALTLALGILFFLKYAADNNWIGPVGRLLAGLLIGLSLVGFGERLLRTSQSALAQGIAGCGFAILYITSYATSAFYKLLVVGASFALMAASAALMVTWAVRMKSQALAIAAFLGLLTVPLWQHLPRGAAVESYILLTVLAGIFIAVNQQWPVLIITNVLVTLLATLVLDERPLAFVVLLALMAAAHWIARFRVADRRLLPNTLYIAGHATLLLAGLRSIELVTAQTSVALTFASILLALYGIGLLAWGVKQVSNVNRLTGLVCLGLVVAKLYLYDIWQLSYGFRITAFVVLGILLLGASFIYSRWKTRS